MVMESSPFKINLVNCGEACYRRFLIDNKMDLLHNIDESLKSINEKIEAEEQIAWAEYEKLLREAPSDDENEELSVYKQSEISKIAAKLELATKDFLQKKQDLLETKERLCKAVFNISRNKH